MTPCSTVSSSRPGIAPAAERILDRMRPILRGDPKRGCKALRREPMIVEFVGHAGSGKTFLRERLVAALSGNYKVSWEIRVTPWDILGYAFLRPGTILEIVKLVLSTRPGSLRAALKATAKFLFYQVKRRKCGRDGCEIMIFDEGMLHRLRMLRSNSASGSLSYADIRPEVRQRIFPKPDLVVFVVASLETTAQRKVTRDATPGGEGIDQMIRRKRANFDSLVARTEGDIRAARHDQHFSYLRIHNENTSSVAENIQRILNEITALDAETSFGQRAL